VPDDKQPSPTPFAIIAGFGIPGREVANLLDDRGVPFVVVEMNPQTVQRTAKAGLNIIHGDIATEPVLRAAGIDRATLLALAIPDDAAVLRTIDLALRLNPRVRILARCRRVSAAIEATRRGRPTSCPRSRSSGPSSPG
jgi:CPA2 family monovalent cation:H+ antiporter-2